MVAKANPWLTSYRRSLLSKLRHAQGRQERAAQGRQERASQRWAKDKDLRWDYDLAVIKYTHALSTLNEYLKEDGEK